MDKKRIPIASTVVAVALALLIVLRDNPWGAVAAGVLGALLVSGIFFAREKRPPDELDLLEPIPFRQGEGNWQVHLNKRGTSRVLTVLSRSFDTDLAAALKMISDLPVVLVSDATEPHARELVDRLRKADAAAEAIAPPFRTHGL